MNLRKLLPRRVDQHFEFEHRLAGRLNRSRHKTYLIVGITVLLVIFNLILFLLSS